MLILRARKNVKLQLTERQNDILIGCVLGDAYIDKRGKIQVEHSNHQKEYVQWKYDELETISYGSPAYVVRADQRYNRKYSSYRFWTRQFFRSWREKFYSQRKKVFSEECIHNLSPLSLAVWYMDDGYLDNGRKIVLSTDNFDEESIENIRECFNFCFLLGTAVKSNGKMIFSQHNTRRFVNIVSPFIIPSMKYKIALTP